MDTNPSQTVGATTPASVQSQQMPLPPGYFVPAQFTLPPLIFQADWALFVASVEAQSKRYRIWTYVNPDQSEPVEPPANADFSAIQAYYAITNALAASNSKYGIDLAMCQTPREMLQLLRKHYRPDPSRLLETFIRQYDELSKGPVGQKFDKWADEFERLVISSKVLDDSLYRDRSSYLWATSAYEAIRQADRYDQNGLLRSLRSQLSCISTAISQSVDPWSRLPYKPPSCVSEQPM